MCKHMDLPAKLKVAMGGGLFCQLILVDGLKMASNCITCLTRSQYEAVSGFLISKFCRGQVAITKHSCRSTCRSKCYYSLTVLRICSWCHLLHQMVIKRFDLDSNMVRWFRQYATSYYIYFSIGKECYVCQRDILPSADSGKNQFSYIYYYIMLTAVINFSTDDESDETPCIVVQWSKMKLVDIVSAWCMYVCM